MKRKVWLVTGAARGLGRDLATAILERGDALLAAARRPEQLADLVERYGDRIEPFALDITDAARDEAAVARAVERFGRLDVLVNNAGQAMLAAIEDISLEDFRAQVELNLFGAIYLTKAALPRMRAQGSGHVIQVSSLGGRLASPGLAGYQTSKWGLGGFSEILAREAGPLGVRVTVLEPGGMRTDWSGASMTVPPISPPYEPVIGPRAEMYARGAAGASDPASVAEIVLAVADMDDPPVRLLIGSDAVQYAAAASRARAESDARWRELSTSADHAEATAEQLNPEPRNA